jgi:NAD(P)-dependent dehydrogenase (short-subunit alcohol dehydrogenase family)
MNALVTGGTGGIGKEIARGLAQRGARVMIVGHDAGNGADAVRELPGTVEFLQADLTSMVETERLAREVSRRCDTVHTLVLSAGMVRGRRVLTPEGIESNFALGYLSRFALVGHVQHLLRPAARILIVNGAARNGTIHYEDVNLGRRFSTIRVVSQLAAANDVFTLELARRRPDLTVLGLKLGPVRTGIRRQFPLWMKILVPLFLDPFVTQPVERIGEAALRLLVSAEFESARGRLFQFIRRFKPVDPGTDTGSPDAGRRLWELSARLVVGAVDERHLTLLR